MKNHTDLCAHITHGSLAFHADSLAVMSGLDRILVKYLAACDAMSGINLIADITAIFDSRFQGIL